MEHKPFKPGKDDQEKAAQKPFKLCFKDKNVLGQSNVKIGRILTLDRMVVPLKFYDKTNDKIDPVLIEKYIDVLKKDRCLENGGLPRTENQRY